MACWTSRGSQFERLKQCGGLGDFCLSLMLQPGLLRWTARHRSQELLELFQQLPLAADPGSIEWGVGPCDDVCLALLRLGWVELSLRLIETVNRKFEDYLMGIDLRGNDDLAMLLLRASGVYFGLGTVASKPERFLLAQQAMMDHFCRLGHAFALVRRQPQVS